MSDATSDHEPASPSRRRLLGWLGGVTVGVVAAGVAGYELVDHGVLPGKSLLNSLDGACSLPPTTLRFGPTSPLISGSFHSAARRTDVGYWVGVPADFQKGEDLPLIVMLHGYGRNHRGALTKMRPDKAVALMVNGHQLPRFALATVDGGPGYWNPHPTDNPMAMVVDEFVPLLRRTLGVGRTKVGLMGESMGGYGAIEIAERNPGFANAVGAISPAIWSSYAEARGVTPGAYSSAAAFRRADAITHASALRDIPLRVAVGVSDPFYGDVEKFLAELGPNAEIYRGKGCHGGSFFVQQEPPTLAFLAKHLS